MSATSTLPVDGFRDVKPVAVGTADRDIDAGVARARFGACNITLGHHI
jgi:hypothetical protein